MSVPSASLPFALVLSFESTSITHLCMEPGQVLLVCNRVPADKCAPQAKCACQVGGNTNPASLAERWEHAHTESMHMRNDWNTWLILHGYERVW
eukprot:scaffold67755_cov19-Tisochrysis_lutea.AAC.1